MPTAFEQKGYLAKPWDLSEQQSSNALTGYKTRMLIQIIYNPQA